MKGVPSDTQMRERLDPLSPQGLRSVFTRLFALVQRAKILEPFLFLDPYDLIRLDGTGTFSSHDVHCANCCVKHPKNGDVTSYHQMLTAALVHPEQKVVFPLAPEPLRRSDGMDKNDCEMNAAKRWCEAFRREHPHLPVVVLLDGLFAHAPMVKLLKKYNMRFIIVCQESNHKWLMDWWNAAREPNVQRLTYLRAGSQETYMWMKSAPLSDAGKDCEVGVLRYEALTTTGKRKVKTKRSQWMWITDLPLTSENVHLIKQGARTRWKTENEVHHTLKNQGYHFEHNFGHGRQNLSAIFGYLMMLAFFIDQCLQHVNKRWQAAYAYCKNRKYALWDKMRLYLQSFGIPSFEALYEAIARPPPRQMLPQVAC